MSYCRFENTAHDFSDCLNAIDEAFDMNDIPINEFVAELSEDERRAYDRLVIMSKRLVAIEDERNYLDDLGEQARSEFAK
jgi:hypothetical protein